MSIVINKPGTVVTDGVTMKGNGSVTSPLSTKLKTTLINLTLANYQATEPGYYVNISSSPGGNFRFPTNINANLFSGDEFIIVNACSFKIQVFSQFYNIYSQGQNTQFINIPAFCSATFIFDATTPANEVFRALTTSYRNTETVDLDAWGSNYTITEVLNYYRFYNNTTGYEIVLPDPQFYNGVEFTIINAYSAGLGYNGTIGFQPVNINGATVTAIGSHRSHTLLSIDNTWTIINIQN